VVARTFILNGMEAWEALTVQIPGSKHSCAQK